MQHVVSAATGPGASLGLTQVGGVVVETFQWALMLDSGFRTEDLISNHVGFIAAHDNMFFSSDSASSSLGTRIQAIVEQLNYQTRSQAHAYFRKNF